MRRVRCRLEHDGVAGDQGRHHLPARDRNREVPGRDDPGHADRLADRHRPLVGQLRGRRVTEHPASFAGHQERDVDALLDVAASLGQDLAHLARHRSGDPLLVLGQERAEAIEELSALRGRGRAPARQRRLRSSSGPPDVGRRARLEPADDVARVGRVVALEHRAGRRIDPLAGDELPERWRLLDPRIGRCAGMDPIVVDDHRTNLLRHVRRRPPPSRHRPGTASPARSGPRDGAARGAAWRRSARRLPRSDGRARSRHRSR